MAGGLYALQPPVPLPAARRAQRVNDEPVKVLNLLFFVYFIWKWGETLEKPHFLTFEPKPCFYLTHSARKYFEKVAFKEKQKTKNATVKTKDNSESKITFSESSFNFLQNRVVFGRGLRPLQPGAAASGSPDSKS